MALILIVDDSPTEVYAMKTTLEKHGYEIASAHDGMEAYEIARKIHPDMIFMDVVMPGINGRELGRRAQQARPGIKILYMTGYSRNAVVHQGRLDEGVELLEKPISQAKLALRVREMLDRLGPES